jgi:hypothetical protein
MNEPDPRTIDGKVPPYLLLPEQTQQEKDAALLTVEDAQGELSKRIRTNMHFRPRPDWLTKYGKIPLDPVQFYASLADVPIVDHAPDYDCDLCHDKGCRHCQEVDEPESELDRAERMALRTDEDKLD